MSATGTQLSCQELVELVTDYLEGQLDAARLAALDEHLAACDSCETYIDQMRQTIAALRRIDGGEQMFPRTRETLLAALHEHHASD